MSDSIRLSPKHGVNPSVMLCFYCGEAYGVALPGQMGPRDLEAPRQAVWEMEPCSKCKDWMRQGIILIGIDPEKSDAKKGVGGFYRTGKFTVIKEEAFRRIFHGDAADFGLKHRWCFVDDAVWAELGIPTEMEEKREGEGRDHVDTSSD